jgi:hypothetical protein
MAHGSPPKVRHDGAGRCRGAVTWQAIGEQLPIPLAKVQAGSIGEPADLGHLRRDDEASPFRSAPAAGQDVAVSHSSNVGPARMACSWATFAA